MPIGASSSAPQLRDSPYAQALASSSKSKSTKWMPPPGAFNKPDLPPFPNPGPGRYNVNADSVKPRVRGARFGSEDRFKYLGPQLPLETTSGGIAGMYTPQAATSPGPGYMPSYSLVMSASRQSAFTVERRDTSGVAPGGGATTPGPGLYNPSEKVLSQRKNYTPGGAFLADDRHKYLGNVDPDSGMVRNSTSPGPLYNPTDHLSKARAPTVSFGGRGPGSIKKPPSLKMESPGPGSYNVGGLATGAVLSGKRRSAAAGFGSTQRGDSSLIDSSQCFHGKVAVDMTHANNISISPGPGYKPSVTQTKVTQPRPTIGTAKRTTSNMAIVR